MNPARQTDEIRARLEAIKSEKRSRIRWRLSHHTAELAIHAIEGRVSMSYRPGTKCRRRKKHKRLL